MRDLDKYEMLLIRACKACRSYDETIRRLKRILGLRSGIDSCYISMGDIKYFLIKIIEDYNLSTISNFVSKVVLYDEYSRISGIEDQDHIFLACKTIITHTTPRRDFPDFISPAKFRKIHEKIQAN